MSPSGSGLMSTGSAFTLSSPDLDDFLLGGELSASELFAARSLFRGGDWSPPSSSLRRFRGVELSSSELSCRPLLGGEASPSELSCLLLCLGGLASSESELSCRSFRCCRRFERGGDSSSWSLGSSLILKSGRMLGKEEEGLLGSASSSSSSDLTMVLNVEVVNLLSFMISTSGRSSTKPAICGRSSSVAYDSSSSSESLPFGVHRLVNNKDMFLGGGRAVIF